MSFAKASVLLLGLILSGCENIKDNLAPESEDKRPSVNSGSSGTAVSQQATDFTIPDTLNNSITMSTELVGSGGLVFYFTMWCPVCDSHMSHIRSSIIPSYPNIKFYFVDYVSGSVSLARSAQVSNGYTDPSYTVLVDISQTVLNQYNGTMGTTVVIDSTGTVAMNEDYKDGSRLNSILSTLP